MSESNEASLGLAFLVPLKLHTAILGSVTSFIVVSFDFEKVVNRVNVVFIHTFVNSYVGIFPWFLERNIIKRQVALRFRMLKSKNITGEDKLR